MSRKAGEFFPTANSAPDMMRTAPIPARRVKKPKKSPAQMSSSETMTRGAITAGSPRPPADVHVSIVRLHPAPPNQPSAFWVP